MSERLDPGLAEPPNYPRHRPLSAHQARILDAEATRAHGIPSFVLMEHASRALAQLAARLGGSGARWLVVCGPGNNGGDGHGMARFLASWGITVERAEVRPPIDSAVDARLERDLAASETLLHPLAHGAEALDALLRRSRPDWIVDAMFGVGLSRPLEAPWTDLIEALNGAQTPILAVDVPSGLCADTGRPLPRAVRAAVTATMVAPKQGLLEGEGPRHAGQIVEIDIGLPRALHAPYLLAEGP